MVSKRSHSGRASSRAPADLRTGLIALLKRPGVWLLGIVGTIATAYVTTTLTDLTKPLPQYVSQLACSWRGSKAPSDEPKFTVLVSRLYRDDADDSQTRRVLEAFQGERGFRPVLLCDTLKFDFKAGEDLQKAEDAAINRGQHLIVEHSADLLIFGEVLLANNAIRVFAINEHGGCDTRPKPVVLQNGLLPDEFDRDTKMQLIGVTLREIASACDGEEYLDWDLFEKRIQKMGAFIERSAGGLTPEQYTEAASSYAEAMTLLYRNDRGDHWYAKALAFDQDQLAKLPADAGPYRHFLLLNAYALLLGEKATRTGDPADLAAEHAVYDQAISEAERDPQPRPKYADAYLNRYCTCEGDDFDKALAMYDRGIQLRPDYSWGYERRGDAYAERGDDARAIAEYDIATRLDPRDRSAFVSRGIVYAKQGDHDRAIRDYDQAIELNPKNASAFQWRAASYEKKGDFERAIRDRDAAVKIDPKDDVSFYTRGWDYSKLGDNDHAMQDFERAAQLNPKSYLAFWSLGIAHHRASEFARAATDYDQAISLKPDDGSLFLHRGYAKAALGNYDQAIADYTQALRLDPKLAMALHGRAIAYSNNGQYDLAIADYDAALQARSDWAEPLYGRGIAKLKRGDSDGNADIAKATALDADVAGEFARRGGRP
jgi:tetratricopeptide (TPR) repeat protein